MVHIIWMIFDEYKDFRWAFCAYNFCFSMNAGVGLISFSNKTFNDTVVNNTVLVDNVINLVKTDSNGAEDGSLACPWHEIGQEPIVLANQQVESGSNIPVEVLFLKINEKMVFQYRIFSFSLIEVHTKISMFSLLQLVTHKVRYTNGSLQYCFEKKNKTENNL